MLSISADQTRLLTVRCCVRRAIGTPHRSGGISAEFAGAVGNATYKLARGVQGGERSRRPRHPFYFYTVLAIRAFISKCRRQSSRCFAKLRDIAPYREHDIGWAIATFTAIHGNHAWMLIQRGNERRNATIYPSVYLDRYGLMWCCLNHFDHHRQSMA